MIDMVERLLQYARMGRTQKVLESVEIEKIMDSVLLNLDAVIQENCAKVELGNNMPTVLGDEIALIQLFQDLIANAVKFRGEESPIIQVEAQQEDKMWHISIKDNGIGIESEYLNQIFTLFTRVHSQGEYEGSGIGLATCKKIVEQHKGRIGVESEFGSGSIFYFTLQGAD